MIIILVNIRSRPKMCQKCHLFLTPFIFSFPTCFILLNPTSKTLCPPHKHSFSPRYHPSSSYTKRIEEDKEGWAASEEPSMEGGLSIHFLFILFPLHQDSFPPQNPLLVLQCSPNTPLCPWPLRQWYNPLCHPSFNHTWEAMAKTVFGWKGQWKWRLDILFLGLRPYPFTSH